MKHILIPTDFSDNAWNALTYGIELFQKTKCTFYVMHINTIPRYTGAGTSVKRASGKLADTLLKDSMENLNALIARTKELPLKTEHTFVPLAFYSHFTETVKGVVETKNIDLIIMGTKGATGAKEVLFGSNTANIIKKSKCPVIAIPLHSAYKKPEEILFPTDYEIQYEKETFHQLLDIVKAYTSSVNVLHVSTGYDLTQEQEKNKQQLKKLLGSSSVFHNVPDNSIITAVNEFQVKTPVDLIVMVQNKHTFMERLFNEPIIKKIGFHVTVPFMVIPQL